MRVACCFFLCGFVQFCSALDINCTVTDDGTNTTYNIFGGPQVLDAKASKCEYSYDTNRVLANHKDGVPNLVVIHSINALVTSECFNNITFIRKCISEGTEHTAICMTNCTLNALRRSQKDKEVFLSWFLPVVAVAVILVVLLVFLCYKCRDKTPRTCSRSQPGAIYSAVKTQIVGPKADDVEAGSK